MKKIFLASLLATTLLSSVAFASNGSNGNDNGSGSTTTPSFSGSIGNTMTIGSGSQSITSAMGGSATAPTYAISGNVGAGFTSVSASPIAPVGTSTSVSFNVGGGLASAGGSFNENGNSYGQVQDITSSSLELSGQSISGLNLNGF